MYLCQKCVFLSVLWMHFTSVNYFTLYNAKCLWSIIGPKFVCHLTKWLVCGHTIWMWVKVTKGTYTLLAQYTFRHKSLHSSNSPNSNDILRYEVDLMLHSLSAQKLWPGLKIDCSLASMGPSLNLLINFNCIWEHNRLKTFYQHPYMPLFYIFYSPSLSLSLSRSLFTCLL